MSILIGNNCVVSIYYTLTDDAGRMLDSSKFSGPLNYLHGANNLVPGLEHELTGKRTGDNFKVSIDPENAYGEYKEELVKVVPIAMFEDLDKLETGMQFESNGSDGEEIVIVTHIEDGEVTVDGNHPLAGKTLHFEVSIESVRDATAEELEHRHVHEHGHHH